MVKCASSPCSRDYCCISCITIWVHTSCSYLFFILSSKIFSNRNYHTKHIRIKAWLIGFYKPLVKLHINHAEWVPLPTAQSNSDWRDVMWRQRARLPGLDNGSIDMVHVPVMGELQRPHQVLPLPLQLRVLTQNGRQTVHYHGNRYNHSTKSAYVTWYYSNLRNMENHIFFSSSRSRIFLNGMKYKKSD